MTLNLPLTRYPITGTQIACPLCGSEQAVPLSGWDRRFKRLPHVKCGECGLIRHEFMPSDAELARYYRESYRRDYQRASTGPSGRHIAKRHAEAAPRLERLARHVSPGASIVDFGCGSGEFVEDAIAVGFDARGFEPGADYARHARDAKGLPVENCGWQAYSVAAPVDAVTSFHVFEHLLDPLAALTRVSAWLKPDGVFYVEVPDMNTALRKGFGALHMAHTLGFSRYTVELLGARAGLAVVDVDNDYDIGMVFRRGKPRPLDRIKADAVAQMAPWTRRRVHRAFWPYTLSKLKRR
jgi:2-polyprenyl-3-methyl-5-hydroxy-6-metoxy-1,4-benzoquinol methylase